MRELNWGPFSSLEYDTHQLFENILRGPGAQQIHTHSCNVLEGILFILLRLPKLHKIEGPKAAVYVNNGVGVRLSRTGSDPD